MDQSELGKTEEEEVNPSSAELSGSEMATEPDSGAAAPATGAGESPTVDEESAASTADENLAAAEVSLDADDTDDEGPIVDDANGLRRGDVVEGTVLRTTPTNVFIDLGEGREGIVPGRELELMTRKMLEDLVEGAPIAVFVVNPQNHKGEIVLSINQAVEEIDWREAESYRQSKKVYDGKVGGYNKGGLIVRFGQLRGFVPQSQIAEARLRQMQGETPEERYGRMVNQNISVKVMEVDRGRNRLILSERAAMREVRQRRKESLITELQVDEVREGTVVSLENFGAFVDVGGAEGLVHLTELSWKHVTHPRQALSVGDKVRVKVISIDPDQNRIGLSIKQIQEDPWDEIRAKYGDGALVRATVTKLTKFGAFARLMSEEGVEGLIHISELSDDRVEHPRDVVNKGDELTLRVVKVDVRNRRLGLSLKRVNSPEYLDQDLVRAFDDLDAGVPGLVPSPRAAVRNAPSADEDDDETDAAAQDETQGSVVASEDTPEVSGAVADEPVVELATEDETDSEEAEATPESDDDTPAS